MRVDRNYQQKALKRSEKSNVCQKIIFRSASFKGLNSSFATIEAQFLEILLLKVEIELPEVFIFLFLWQFQFRFQFVKLNAAENNKRILAITLSFELR